MKMKLLAPLVISFGLFFGACDHEHPRVLSHRAQGFGVAGENLVENVPAILNEGIGLEIDIRGDGQRAFELGHNGPEGENLEDVITLIEEEWRPSYAGQIVMLDVANDSGDLVSRNLIPYLIERLAASPARDIRWMIQSSNEQTLARFHQDYASTGPHPFSMEFCLTLWFIVEYTPPVFVDYLITNINELPPYPYPLPVIAFGVTSRHGYEQAVSNPSNIEFVLADHPRRILLLQQDFGDTLD